MILADTSVWIDHFRHGNDRLMAYLEGNEVAVHPFVIGEIACGNLKNRAETLELLNNLPLVNMVTQDEALVFIDRHRLFSSGLGFIDIHLLAAAKVSGVVGLWTLDKRLAGAAETMKIGF